MAFCDFVIRYNPKIDTAEDIAKKIIYSVIVKRLKAHKPAVIFIGGDSGEGKSLTALRLQEIILETQGLALKDYINDINVFVPIEYPTKLEALLHSDRLKKVNIITMHEARTIIKAKLWHSFLSQTIADVNALARSVKRLCTIVISQFIRDITTDTRYTINFYCTVRRPKGQKARLYINVLWKDDRDLEKPRLRKRKLSGYLVYPNGKYRRLVPTYLEIKLPDKELVNKFEEQDYLAKKSIIKRKIGELIGQMKKEIGEDSNKVDTIVDWYIDNQEMIKLVGSNGKRGFKINKRFKEIHELTPDQIEDFQNKFTKRLTEIQGIE